jgi:ADP-ribosylation factor-like protein 3
MLGLDNAGKTTLLYYLIGVDNKNTRPTPGVNAKSFQYEGNKIDLYDLGGQKAIREYWEYYYENVDALIYVFDVTDKERIGESYEVIQKLLEEDQLLNVPILFYGNKCDLTNELDAEEINKNFKLSKIKGRDWSLFFCSALKGKGIKDGLKWLFNLDYFKKKKI